MATDEEQLARNEAAFRRANEDIDAALERHGYDADVAPFICECSDQLCRTLIRVPLRKYHEVRSVPLRAIVAAGHHERPGHGTRVVELFEEFLVVEKLDDAARTDA